MKKICTFNFDTNNGPYTRGGGGGGGILKDVHDDGGNITKRIAIYLLISSLVQVE